MKYHTSRYTVVSCARCDAPRWTREAFAQAGLALASQRVDSFTWDPCGWSVVRCSPSQPFLLISVFMGARQPGGLLRRLAEAYPAVQRLDGARGSAMGCASFALLDGALSGPRLIAGMLFIQDRWRPLR